MADYTIELRKTNDPKVLFTDIISVSAAAIEISSEATMTSLLVEANVGKAYKFTGTTGTYINGDIYVVEESDD